MLKKEKIALLEYTTILSNSNLSVGTWGNISIRKGEHVVITPSGIPYDQTTIDDLVITNLYGDIVSGYKKPSSELAAHLAIYNNYKNWSAIVHTHSIFTSAYAAAHRSIPTLIEDHAQIIGGDIEVAQYALPGTSELADNIVIALKDKSALLLANHGLIACGTSISEAFITAEVAEKSAQIALFTSQIGGGVPLSQADINIMRTNYLQVYKKLQESAK